jgi:ubiquitin carboxyl-terminal hydrolase 7
VSTLLSELDTLVFSVTLHGFPTRPDTTPDYVGLRNQGATGYMNVILQSLFHIPAFRAIVYAMPTTDVDDPRRSIPLNLQRLFCRMQTAGRECSTRSLTESFGWDDAETRTQHDAHEFCRVLVNGLEMELDALLRGRCRTCIRCFNVPYEAITDEVFYDLSLQVRNCASLQQAFRQYIEPEDLTGDNQRDTDFGKQDAEMAHEFLEFPPVLQLHLRRVEYDLRTCRNVKVNDRFEFGAELDLGPFLAESADRTKSQIYDLYGVIVHSGEPSYGHYHAFIRPTAAPQWYEFNDSCVEKVTPEKAIAANFGDASVDRVTSAYVLVYVRRADAPSIMWPVRDDEIPEHVRNSPGELDDDGGHAKDGVELYDVDEAVRRNALSGRLGFTRKDCGQPLHIEPTDTHDTVYRRAAALAGVRVAELRLWQSHSTPGSPSAVLMRGASAVGTTLRDSRIFWSRKPADEPVNRSLDVITVYLKFFCLRWDAPLQYLGSYAAVPTEKCAVVLAEICRRMGLPRGTALLVSEETLSVRRLRFFPAEEIMTTGVRTGCSLIFEFQEGEIWPVTFQPLPPIERDVVDRREDRDIPVGLRVHRLGGSGGATLEHWVSVNVATRLSIILFAYCDQTTPIAALQVPSTTTWADLCTLIVSAADLDSVDGEDTLTLYRKDYDAERPEASPLAPGSYPTIQHLFYADQKRYLYYRLLQGVDPHELANGFLLPVIYTEDFRTVTRQIEVLLSRDGEFADLRARLEASRFLEGVERPLRFITLSDGRVTDCRSGDWIDQRSKYFVVVDDGEPSRDNVLYFSLAEVDSNEYLETVGIGLPIRTRPGLTLEQAILAIAPSFALDLATTNHAWVFKGGFRVRFARESALSRNFDLGRLQTGTVLYVVFYPGAKPNGRDRGVTLGSGARQRVNM